MSLPPPTVHPPRVAHFADNLEDIVRPLTPADELDEQPDIYRGEPPVQRPLSPLHPPSVSSASSSSSSTSSASSAGRGRWRGSTLATLVEHAISRWGRRSSMSDSSSSDSSSSSSSSGSHSHTTRKRRRRQGSMSSQSRLHFDPEAYAARKKAREDAKLMSREFVLYLPSSLTPNPNTTSGKQKPSPLQTQVDQQRVLRTTSQKVILAQLDFALKRAAKLRRPPRVRTQNLETISASAPGSGATTPLGSFQDLQKLKRSKAKELEDPVEAAQRAWWLDVSNPTWADMRAIGKLLHLHPLTLEDIVQREPREKLELFPKLGYYFVSFRAMESEQSRNTAAARNVVEVEDEDSNVYADPEVVQGVNMYLVVFREGICSFHFEDMADHTERVRKKLLDLQSTLVMSSDFVCHGLIDSIVDSFYPVFQNIEREVEAIDALIVSIGANTDKELQNDRGMGDVTDLLRVVHGGAAIEKAAAELHTLPSSPGVAAEKQTEKASSHFLPFNIAGPTAVSQPLIARLRKAVAITDRRIGWIVPFRRRHVQPQQTMVTLLRITNTRRLVTQLGRLLAAKSEVVAQLQKRLVHVSGTGGDLDWGGNGVNGEIAAYMGDVQDHIIFLQQSLAHYERILGHSHPAYISHLRISFSQARGGVDKAIVGLTSVSVMVLCMQCIIGIFSMNVLVPRNALDGTKYTVFACVLSAACLVGAGVIGLVRFWWTSAKRRYARRAL